MKRFSVIFIIAVYSIISLHNCPVSGVIFSATEFTLDITDANDFAKKATWWSESQNVSLTKKGLILNAPENLSADVRIQVITPIGVGLSWRPAQSVHIVAEVNPPGQYVFRGTSISYPSGTLYASYSADALHWSDWQYVKMDIPKDQNEPKQTYSGTLTVPQAQREEYSSLFRQYQQTNVHSKSDEEAACEWIIQNRPDFFEKNPAPFIGYVKFLYEVSLQGEQKVKNITFEINWAVGGLFSSEKNKNGEIAYPDLSTPWRFKSSSLPQK